ncbi:MAG TPA: hypothetical protein VFR23_24605 [Jiangellaceae bacterium]|nr:hypothetical protein [Jiangellaceae bacterium]
MAFLKFAERHDPNGRKDWTFQWVLSAGEAIASATVDVVDSTGTTIDAATDLVIESTAFGQISGTLYGVTVWITGGTAGVDYYLRCRIETTNAPISRKDDMTMTLLCRQL